MVIGDHDPDLARGHGITGRLARTGLPPPGGEPIVAAQVRRWLQTGQTPGPGITLIADPPLRWIAPQTLRRGDPAPARHRLLVWSDASVPVPLVQVIHDGKVLTSRRLPWPAAPGRVFRIPS
jgi:hypothetical protein